MVCDIVAAEPGDHCHASRLARRSGVRDARAADDDWLLTYSLNNLAQVLARRGDVHEAEALTRECLAAARHVQRAARLLGATDPQIERLGTTPEQPPEGLEDLRIATSSGAQARAREQGRTLTLQAAIDEALCDSPHQQPVSVDVRLTRRELEIAALVAQGLSNLQIAERLVITEGTTQNHVSHILDKLGATTRTLIAAWVLGQRARKPGQIAIGSAS
jgi:DNA-binding NarL/FixJ family response regulator